ncbi:unnamed protein product, partial [Onchocerca ochengi]|uniref:Uncharacterized protein n=1 Tax=Onchocerca ochengi TaxID=42157 RepID=A0A182EU07_ONCOC
MNLRSIKDDRINEELSGQQDQCLNISPAAAAAVSSCVYIISTSKLMAGFSVYKCLYRQFISNKGTTSVTGSLISVSVAKKHKQRSITI